MTNVKSVHRAGPLQPDSVADIVGFPFEDFEHGMELMRDGICGKVVFQMP